MPTKHIQHKIPSKAARAASVRRARTLAKKLRVYGEDARQRLSQNLSGGDHPSKAKITFRKRDPKGRFK